MNFNFTFPPAFEELPESPPVMSPLSNEEQYNAVELKSQLPALEEVLSHPALQQYVRRFEEVCVVPKNLIEYVQLHLEELLSVLDEANANMNKECYKVSTENNSTESNSNNNTDSSGEGENKSKSSSKTNEEDSDDDDDYNSNDAEPKCSTWISNCNNFKREYVDDDINDNNDSKNEIDKNCNSVNIRNRLISNDIVSSNACNDSLERNSFTNNDNACNCLHKEECEVPELILSAKSPSKHFDPTSNFINKPHSPLSCDCNSFDSINEVNVSSTNNNNNNNNTRANGRMEEESCKHEDKIELSEMVPSDEEKNVVENYNVKEVQVDLPKRDVNNDTRRLRCANAGELLLAYMIDTTSVFLINKLVPIYLEALCGSISAHSTLNCNKDDVLVENENINSIKMKPDIIIEVEFAHHALLTCFDTSFVETTKSIKTALTSTMIDRITANLHHYSVVETLISLFGSALPATTMMAASTEPCIFTEH